MYKKSRNGKKATLVCKKGFIPTPPTTINCGEDGNWAEPSAICQTTSFSGTDFVMVFPRVTLNVGGKQDIRQLQMVTPEPTVVNITSDFNAINLRIWLTTNVEVDIDTSITLLTGKQVTNKVLRIESTTPITVHGLCYRVKRREVGMDSYLVLPTEQLGTEYIVVTTNTTAQFAVAAVKDGTHVIILYPDSTILTKQKLNSHEVYTYFRRGSTVSLTGYVIMSDKPVAVFSGGYYSSIPSINCSSRDTAIEQMIPVHDWYKLCIIAPFFPDEEFLYEVVASVDGTNLDVTVGNTTTQKTINRWCALQDLVTSNEAVVITSDNPILVVLFSVSKAVTGRAPGDGAMVQCIDPKKYLNIYTFFVNDLFNIHYVRIIIRDKFKSDLILNGNPVLSISVYSLSVTAPDGDMYTVLYVVVDPNVQYVLQTTSGARFGADAYGFTRAGQYAHNLGQFFP